MRKLRASDITLPVGVESWEDLQGLGRELPGWMFRGHSDLRWRLQPTLERWVQTHGGTQADIEQHLLREWPCRVSQWLPDAPHLHDAMGWLAIMQHYGGPTRLLDLTTSLLVATFFALEEAADSGHSVVWAINDAVVRGRLEQILCDTDGVRIPCRDALDAGDLLNLTLGAKYEGPAAAAGVPRAASSRERIQKGRFLFGLNLDYSLEQNLYGMFDVSPEDVYPRSLVGWFKNPLNERLVEKLRRRPVIKIFIDNRVRQPVLRELEENGVSRTSLFPESDAWTACMQEELRATLLSLSDGTPR